MTSVLQTPLPSWLKDLGDGLHIDADADSYYPILFNELLVYAKGQQKRLIEAGIKPASNSTGADSTLTMSASDAEILAGCNELASCIKFSGEKNVLDTKALTQYCLEVAYQCLKMDAQHSVRMAGCDPRSGGESLQLGIRTKLKDSGVWTLKTHKAGRGEQAATKGREAREHYKRMRGFVPE